MWNLELNFYLEKISTWIEGKLEDRRDWNYTFSESAFGLSKILQQLRLGTMPREEERRLVGRMSNNTSTAAITRKKQWGLASYVYLYDLSNRPFYPVSLGGIGGLRAQKPQYTDPAPKDKTVISLMKTIKQPLKQLIPICFSPTWNF